MCYTSIKPSFIVFSLNSRHLDFCSLVWIWGYVYWKFYVLLIYDTFNTGGTWHVFYYSLLINNVFVSIERNIFQIMNILSPEFKRTS